MLFLFKLFLWIFIPIFIFCLYARQFANPYKNIFLFGKKGSGKSTLMIKWLLKAQKKGWNIYTDMQDCLIPGVRIIEDARQLEKFTPEKNSLLALEEVGITFDKRDFKTFPKGIRDWFKFERKYKVWVIQNSQSYDIDSKIRDCVDGMWLQSCISGVIGITRPIVKTVTLTAPNGDSEARVAEGLKFAPIFRWKFTWLPRYFKYFDSFDAPPRDPIPYREVTREMYDAKQELRKLNRSWKRMRAVRDKSSAEGDPDN